MLSEIVQIGDARIIDTKMIEIQEELNSLWDVLMGYELQLAEQLEVTNDVIISSVNIYVISYQLKLTKMRAELANLNHCAVPFLSCVAANLCWYYYTI